MFLTWAQSQRRCSEDSVSPHLGQSSESPQPKPLYWYSFNKYHIHKIFHEKVIRNGGFLTLIHIQKQLQEKSMVTLIIIENESVS